MTRIACTTPLGALLLLLAVLPLEGQDRRGGMGGPGGMSMVWVDPVEAVLEEAEKLELTREQIEALTAFQRESLERTADARAMVAPMRERMEGMGERSRPRRGPRSSDRPQRIGGPEMREAMQALRTERETAMDMLRETLSSDQLGELREILGARRPGPRPRR